MSTLSTANIQSKAANTPPVIKDSNGTEIGTFCRAWVNFNGTGTVIKNSFNVSSVTDNSTGNYTINFTTAMPDANYVVTGITSTRTALTASTVVEVYDTTGTPEINTSNVRISTSEVSASLNRQPVYRPFVGIAVFR